MRSTETLETVLEHARAERDAAFAGLRQAEAAAAAARGQAEQLETYRADYRRRWTGRFRESGTIGLLQCVQGFAGRLDQAIAMQSDAVRQSEARVERARAALLERERRVAAVEKLIARRQAEIRLDADRREQRQTDETAARLSAARGASPLT
jgi:flagellar FliJ protein